VTCARVRAWKCRGATRRSVAVPARRSSVTLTLLIPRYVCMYVRVCVCVCVYIYIYVYIIYICIYVVVYIQALKRDVDTLNTQVCMYVCIYIYIYCCIYAVQLLIPRCIVCSCMCVYKYTHACARARTHTHTHTQVYTFKPKVNNVPGVQRRLKA
jgi:hypothetical protein